MNWEAIGAIAEAVGAVGVIATLAYLSVQLRHNTQALRVSSGHQSAQAGRMLLDELTRNGTGELYSIGLRAYPKMATEERRKFVYAFNGFVNSGQEMFAFYEGGVLDTELYVAHLKALACHISTPGGSVLWGETREYFPPRLVAAIEEAVAAGNLPDILESPYFRLDEE